MNSPEDEIPLPSVGVLSEEETSKQLREDMCRIAGQDRILWLERKHREAVARCLELKTQLEGVSSALLIANRDLDARKRAIHAAHGLLAPLGNQVTPSVMAIRETLSILRGAL